MKALCDRESLLNAFGMVAGVAPPRSPKPILQNLKLVVDADQGSTLMATDLEVGIRYRVLGVAADRPGAVILPTQKTQSILKTSAGEKQLALEVDGDHLHIRGLSARFKLATEDPSLFPEFPEFKAAAYHVVNAADLKRLIRYTAFATEPESNRYALGGVLFDFAEAGTLTLVGTDGRRLAHAQADCEVEGTPEAPPAQPVVPAKALKLIERNLTDDEGVVHVAFPSSNAILVKAGQAEVYARLLEGRFPRYRDVFPAAPAHRVPMEAAMFRTRVELASIVTSDESRGVDFKFAPGQLTLSSSAADVGSAQVEMPINYDGDPLEITFDTKYLLDALKVIPDDQTLTVELIDHKSAAVFRTEDRYTYIVMPLTRDG